MNVKHANVNYILNIFSLGKGELRFFFLYNKIGNVIIKFTTAESAEKSESG